MPFAHVLLRSQLGCLALGVVVCISLLGGCSDDGEGRSSGFVVGAGDQAPPPGGSPQDVGMATTAGASGAPEGMVAMVASDGASPPGGSLGAGDDAAGAGADAGAAVDAGVAAAATDAGGRAGDGVDASAPAVPDGVGTVDPGKTCHSPSDWVPKPADIWVSPDGSDAGDGSEGSPKRTLAAAISTWSSGKTIWVMPGTYPMVAAISLSMDADLSGPLRISGVKGGPKPVFDFSGERRATNNNGERGFQISGSYVHLRYLEIAKAADNCVYVTGSYNTLEWLTVYECQDTGVQLSNGASDNRVLNVDSYLNADPSGENADGFAPKLSIGQNNYFCGTRAYHNADDGYDCWASGDSSSVTFDYCWAFGQPGPTATANGDGNGFKLGSPALRASGGNAPHQLNDCFAFENRSAGFTSNGNSSGQVTCTDCGVWGNGAAWSGGSGGVAPKHTGDITDLGVSVEEAINAPRDVNGDLPDIKSL